MRTVTEFFSTQLMEGLKILRELEATTQRAAPQVKAKSNEPVSAAEPSAPAAAEPAASAETQETSGEADASSTQTVDGSAEVSEGASVEAAPSGATAPAESVAPTEASSAPSAADPSQVIGERLKLEGERLKHFVNALEAIRKRSDQIKRVVVLTVTETEKAPTKALKKDEFYYLSEYYPPLPGAQGRQRHGAGPQERGRHGKDRGKKKGRGRRGPRRDDAQARPGEAHAGAEGGSGGRDARGEGRDRPPRRSNRRRPEGQNPGQRSAPQAQPSSGKLPKPLIPVNTPQAAAASQASSPAEAKPEAAQSSES